MSFSWSFLWHNQSVGAWSLTQLWLAPPIAGEQPKVVSVQAMRATAARLEAFGRDVSYSEIAKVEHEAISHRRIADLATGLLERLENQHLVIMFCTRVFPVRK